jgi:class 3 adenylate cyclase
VIEGVRAKVLLKVWLDEVRAILEKALDTLGEHPEILESLVKAINELLQGRLGDALGALEGVLEGLEEGDTVDALLKGRLEDVRAALEQVLEQVGVDEGESRVAIGEGPTDETGEPTQEQER